LTRQEIIFTDKPHNQWKCGILKQTVSEYLHCV